MAEVQISGRVEPGFEAVRAAFESNFHEQGEVDGVRLLSERALADARRPQAEGPDAVLVEETRIASGFFLDGTACPMLGPASYGHSGAGGSLGFADTEAGVAFGYVMNQMNLGLGGDPRAVALVEAVRRSL